MAKCLWEKLSKEELIEIINNSTTYVEVCKKIGYTRNVKSKEKVEKISNTYNINISHLTSGYNKNNLVGQTFGSLKVLKEDFSKNSTKSRNTYWFCECQACKSHTIKSVCSADLRRGKVTSCGCLKTQRIIEYNHNNF